jgi:hypothetical protein
LTERTRSLGHDDISHSQTSAVGLLTQTAFRRFGIFVYPSELALATITKTIKFYFAYLLIQV